jgi:hypothetical protein
MQNPARHERARAAKTPKTTMPAKAAVCVLEEESLTAVGVEVADMVAEAAVIVEDNEVIELVIGIVVSVDAVEDAVVVACFFGSAELVVVSSAVDESVGVASGVEVGSGSGEDVSLPCLVLCLGSSVC